MFVVFTSFHQKYCVIWKLLMFEISAKNGLCDVILGSEEKTSDLSEHFSAEAPGGGAGGQVPRKLFSV